MTFDHGYDGTGNWPFNTAYAARQTGHAFVTRFRSLRGVEQLIRPASPSSPPSRSPAAGSSGAPISASNGHLVVVVGFTQAGDVVVNDPAARPGRGPPHLLAAQFEDAWLQRYPYRGGMRGSGGLAYVIRDTAHPLPPRAGSTSW